MNEYLFKVGGKTIKGAGSDVYTDLTLSKEQFATLLSRDDYTPTLDAAPTSATLSYTDTELGVTATFRTGQLCRVADGDGGGYRFYLCTDVTYDADDNPSATAWERLVRPSEIPQISIDRANKQLVITTL